MVRAVSASESSSLIFHSSFPDTPVHHCSLMSASRQLGEPFVTILTVGAHSRTFRFPSSHKYAYKVGVVDC